MSHVLFNVRGLDVTIQKALEAFGFKATIQEEREITRSAVIHRDDIMVKQKRRIGRNIWGLKSHRLEATIQYKMKNNLLEVEEHVLGVMIEEIKNNLRGLQSTWNLRTLHQDRRRKKLQRIYVECSHKLHERQGSTADLGTRTYEGGTRTSGSWSWCHGSSAQLCCQSRSERKGLWSQWSACSCPPQSTAPG